MTGEEFLKKVLEPSTKKVGTEVPYGMMSTLRRYMNHDPYTATQPHQGNVDQNNTLHVNIFFVKMLFIVTIIVLFTRYVLFILRKSLQRVQRSRRGNCTGRNHAQSGNRKVCRLLLIITISN